MIDPLANDPQFKNTMERYYNEWARKQNEANPDNPITMSFDEFWFAQTDDVRESMYQQTKTGYEQWWDSASRSQEKRAKASKADAKAQAEYDKDFQDAVREAIAAGVQVDPNGEMYRYKERYDKQKKEYAYDKIPMGKPSALQLRIMVAQMKAEKKTREAQLRDIEFMETIRPQREAIATEQATTAQWVAEQQLGELKRTKAEKTFGKPVKEFVIEPVKEIVAGAAMGAAKGMSYRKGAMDVARKSFVPDFETKAYREHPLRAAPRSRFTTPMVTSVPTRMPITTGRTGRKIPAGEAVIAPAKLVKEAVIKPTVAGSLLTTSVGKMPAAQALVPQRPTRLGLSNLRVGVDVSGIKRAGALPRLRIKKNLYNEQLKKIRGLLR